MAKMLLQQILSYLSLWLGRAAARWGISRAKPKISKKWTLWLSLGGLVALAFLFRFFHLFDANHYYILSEDSYFFHWVAQGVMSGQPPPSSPGGQELYTLHSGLAYPLAYIAKAISYVFGLSSTSALDFVTKFLPPVVSVISMVVVYFAVSRIYNKRVGLFSAFAWGSMPYVLMVGAAGYVDRDCLSQLLLIIGAFLFYFSGSWHLKVGNRDVGWLVAALGVLFIEVMLYFEWTFVGPLLLLAVIVIYFAVRLLLGYVYRMSTEPNAMRRLAAAVRKVNWRAFALVMLGNIAIVILIAAVNPQQVTSWFNIVTSIVGQRFGEGGTISELQGLSPLGLFAFQFFLVPMGIGLYLAWKKREEGAIFFACWLLALLVASLFAKRIVLYAAPAACLLSGVGLAYLWDWMRKGESQLLRKVGVTTLLCLLLLMSFFMASSLGKQMAPDKDWQDALAYLRQETPQGSRVMSQWGTGYWILGLGERRPIVDNGYYGHDAARLRDVALAYVATDPAEAAQIMQKWEAEYLVFSLRDLSIDLAVLGWAGLSEKYDSFPIDSLVIRSLNGKFESGGGLEVVHRSEPDGEVVILQLTGFSYP